ncbi:MAG: phosphatase domain-containing putative toxin, partial [Candidatus Limnocylindria bacterium]
MPLTDRPPDADLRPPALVDLRGAMALEGVDVLLLLVEDRELSACGVEDIAVALASRGIAVVRQPIPEMGIPTDVDVFRATLARVAARIAVGDTIAIACRGGLGRSGMAAACLLVGAGL